MCMYILAHACLKHIRTTRHCTFSSHCQKCDLKNDAVVFFPDKQVRNLGLITSFLLCRRSRSQTVTLGKILPTFGFGITGIERE